MRVALYIAAFYGNQELATKMIQMGVRPDKPVGEHPCRQWCQNITPLFKLPEKFFNLKFLSFKFFIPLIFSFKENKKKLMTD